MALTIILIWLAFDIIVYLTMWFEHTYYLHDLPSKYKKVLMSFTEEDDVPNEKR